MTSNAAAIAGQPERHVGPVHERQPEHEPGESPPDIRHNLLRLTPVIEGARHTQQRSRRQERVERGLEDERFIEREEARERREPRGDPGCPFAEPVPGREKHEPDRHGAQKDLEYPDRGEGIGNGKSGGQEIDVERRHEVEPGTEGQVSGHDFPGQFRVGCRVKAHVRLEERMILQLEHDQELENEDDASGEQDARKWRLWRHRRPRHPTFLSFQPTFLSSDCTLMCLDP